MWSCTPRYGAPPSSIGSRCVSSVVGARSSASPARPRSHPSSPRSYARATSRSTDSLPRWKLRAPTTTPPSSSRSWTPGDTARRSPTMRSLLDELLAAVDVERGAGDGGVGHQVHGQGGDVGGPHDPPDRQGAAELLAARVELVAEERRGQRGVDEPGR